MSRFDLYFPSVGPFFVPYSSDRSQDFLHRVSSVLFSTFEKPMLPSLARRNPPFLFCEFDTREDANIHQAIACKYPSNNVCTVVEEWIHGYFRLGCFSSLIHFDHVSLMAQKPWRQCVFGFCGRSWVS